MKAFQQFDLARRGVSDVVEQWQAAHDEVRRVWAVEDVLAAINGHFFPKMRRAFIHFDARGVLPVSEWCQITDLIAELGELSDSLKSFAAYLKKHCADFTVAGSRELAQNIAWMKQVSTALKKELAALQRIEKKSPSNKELLATVARCKPASSWYQSTDML